MRYGQRPSDVIGIPEKLIAYDFDLAVSLRSDEIREGKIRDPELLKDRQSKGFQEMKALQTKVIQCTKKKKAPEINNV